RPRLRCAPRAASRAASFPTPLDRRSRPSVAPRLSSLVRPMGTVSLPSCPPLHEHQVFTIIDLRYSGTRQKRYRLWSATESAADLGQRQAQNHGAAVRGRQREVDAVERAQEGLGLARREAVAGAHDGVAGDLAKQGVEPLGFTGGPDLSPLVEQRAEE